MNSIKQFVLCLVSGWGKERNVISSHFYSRIHQLDHCHHGHHFLLTALSFLCNLDSKDIKAHKYLCNCNYHGYTDRVKIKFTAIWISRDKHFNFILMKPLIHQEYIIAVCHFVCAKNMATMYIRLISTIIVRNLKICKHSIWVLVLD